MLHIVAVVQHQPSYTGKDYYIGENMTTVRMHVGRVATYQRNGNTTFVFKGYRSGTDLGTVTTVSIHSNYVNDDTMLATLACIESTDVVEFELDGRIREEGLYISADQFTFVKNCIYA